MENTNLYCPPSGNHPQELPDRWRFENNVVRRDLKEIDDAELNLWGWEGPYTPPNPKISISKEGLSEEYIELYTNDESLTSDEESNSFVSVTYDYELETHKVVWYSKERRYIILPIDEDSTEYEIPYRSSAELGKPLPNAEIDNKKRTYTYRPTDQLSPPPPILWVNFKKHLINSAGFNQLVTTLMETKPILSIEFPASVMKLDLGMYNDFRIVWDTLNQNELITSELESEIRQIATDCRLPQDFFDILGD